MEINFKSVIQSNEDQMIQLSVENPTVIHMNNKNFDALEQLIRHENIHLFHIKDAGFYRCHRSYLVNLHKVKEIINWSKNSYSVVIRNSTEDKIPLSRTKYSEI